MGYIEGISRKRRITFPECIDEYITDNNPVRAIEAFVDSLDLEELGFKNKEDLNTGRPGYNPADMLKLFLYGYLNRIASSRRLEAEARRNIELMWLLRKLQPDYRTIAEFRKRNKEAIQRVFRQLVSLCKDWDLFGMEIVAVDGSKFRASNSKKNNFNKKSLERKIKYIDKKLQEYMSELDQNDGSEVSSRVADKEEISKRIRELRHRKETYENYQNELKNDGNTEISTTDPDARLMVTNNNGLNVCYNIQTAVDSKHSLVVDCNVINNPADQGQLSVMSGCAKDIFGVDSIKALADKGYYNADDLKECEKKGIETYVPKQVFANATGERDFYPDKFVYDKEKDVYICPAGYELICTRKKALSEKTKNLNYKNNNACNRCEFKKLCTKNKEGRTITRSIDQEFLDTVDYRTSENKELYRMRQTIVEHPFGTIKRGWG
ncbi:IS1182 family transposase, partial [Anaerobacterium chartisolvens]|uniref:IS1182 family transposase n=1 Tax=Anaerobacterium chartisolvens TaxID=1297424 RepID=UPI00147504EC